MLINVNDIIRDVKRTIEKSLIEVYGLDDEALQVLILNGIIEWTRCYYISKSERRTIFNTIYNSMRGYDILQPLIDDNEISEIMVNGPKDIFIEKHGEITKTDLVFYDEEILYEIIQRIVAKVNRIVNESTPIVDARLSNGSRVNVIMPPIAMNGPILTIRKFPKTNISIVDMVTMGYMTKEVAEFLRLLVIAKYNIFICGGTSSGKTTLLNALTDYISEGERIIVIEDSAELRFKGHSNTVRLEARTSNTEGNGEITIKQLIKASLRMRPDRIIVGEVRGSEAIDMLQAMNTGHDGSISTGHSNSPEDMISRLETMVLSGVDIPIKAIHKQITSGIDLLIYVSKLRDSTRRITRITELVDIDNNKIIMNDIYRYNYNPVGKESGCLIRTDNKIINRDKLVIYGYGDKDV